MPDLYQPGDYDLAGFCVGVVEREGPYRRHRPSPRATSRGGHGLQRAALQRFQPRSQSGLRDRRTVEAGDYRSKSSAATAGEALLMEPTRIYAKLREARFSPTTR